MSEVPRSFASDRPGTMSYQDFVWFILAEEDKTTDQSIEYWFRCLDLDGDGLVSVHEMQYFYQEQKQRLMQSNFDVVVFEDIVCQLHDMIQPEREGCFSLADLKKNRQHASVMFNMLVNLPKFIAFETKDPFLARQEREEAGMTDWDRFALGEYYRLSVEDDGGAGGSGDVAGDAGSLDDSSVTRIEDEPMTEARGMNYGEDTPRVMTTDRGDVNGVEVVAGLSPRQGDSSATHSGSADSSSSSSSSSCFSEAPGEAEASS